MAYRRVSYDVAVIGAGPVGSLAAIAFADRGAEVLLLEAQASAAPRLAGEWLHPAALDAIAKRQVELPTSGDGNGFVVFPDDGSAPILLPYTGQRRGRTCDHQLLVSALRQRAQAHPRIHLVTGARVTAITEGIVGYATGAGSERTPRIASIVGADGRSSVARKSLGLPDARAPISSMAGLTLEDVSLPFESFGHVVLGGPGPVLLYRIDARRVRACLDVPHPLPRTSDGNARLWKAYARVLPESLRPALASALERRPIAWAANQYRPRTHYGREGLALIGDAVGHFHPLTAVGLTLGFQDAECLASADGFAAYQKERASRSAVAEILATALFQAFALPDEGTRAVRQAIYQLWRKAPQERGRTMRFLAAEETELGQFQWTLLKVLTHAFEGLLYETAAAHRWSHATQALKGLSGWLEWLPAGVLPRMFPAPRRPRIPSALDSGQNGERPERYATYRAIAQAGK